jgi:hypothetical protein
MTKDAAAEKILKKHWDSLPRHMESYTMSWEQMKKYPDTINALLAAMEEYGASLQPKEADKDMRWVKASDRLPDDDSWQIVRVHDDEGAYVTEGYYAPTFNMFYCKQSPQDENGMPYERANIEWLDESADKDRELEARERESKFLNERINEQYREIERLKAALDACFGVMMQFTSIGKGKFYTPHKLEIILAERKRAETLYYEAQKPLTDKDIQSKWISVEAVKELLAKQRVLCAEYLEDSFSEHPYKLHQMINYAPEPPLPNSDKNVQECDARMPNQGTEPLANSSQPTPKEEDVEKMAISLDDAKKLRGYFGKNDASHFEHWAYTVLDKIIKGYNAAKTTK